MITTTALAAIVGVSPRRLLAIAQNRNIKPAAEVGRAKLWHPRVAKQLVPGRRGRPKKNK